MITTAQLAAKINKSQRTVERRVKLLGLKPQLAGRVFILTHKQAELVKNYKESK